MSTSGHKTTSPPSVRSDVRRNRALIMDAARELFASGEDVPMYRIAKHAGVGQATLYRHFEDRSLLAAALSREALEELEDAANGGAPLEALLARAATLNAGTPGLRRMILEGEGAPMLQETRARLGRLFEAPLREAKRAGRVDEGITREDILLVMQMMEGGMSNAALGSARTRRKTADRAVELVVSALRPTH